MSIGDELERIKRNLKGFLRDSPDHLDGYIKDALFCIDNAITVQKELDKEFEVGDAVKVYFEPTDSMIYGIIKFVYDDTVDIEIQTLFNGMISCHVLQDISIDDVGKV